jgi:stearoyl-CoA desaturase (delta-9 desaturase)
MYSVRDASGHPRTPTLREVSGEFIHSINFVRDRRQALRALFETFHATTFVAGIVFFVGFATLATLACYLIFVVLLANIVNTVWYHRYCSHHAFAFSHRLYTKLFLWLNPIGFREEIYALLHHVHHNIADEDDDPYGPHLGAFGSYVAAGEFEIETDIAAEEYERIKKVVAHVGFPFASFRSFRRWRSVEWIPHYLARWAFATAFWAELVYLAGGVPLTMAWFAAIFTFTFLMRDFNYRGHYRGETPKHAERWNPDCSTRALNQRFYGYIASEWHNNHHSFRTSANCGFLPGQPDLAFALIKAMHKLGIVSRFSNHQALFERKFKVARRS